MYSGILVQEEIAICESHDFSQIKMGDFWLLYPQQEIDWKYMDTKFVLALIFADTFKITKIAQLKNSQ